MKAGKLTLVVDDEGDVLYIEAKGGTKSHMFHRREYSDPTSMSKAVADWFTRKGVAKVISKERAMTGQEALKEQITTQMIFAEIILALAAAAKGLEKWCDFDSDSLADIATDVPIHVRYVEDIFEKIKTTFTPPVFCELAAEEDRPETFVSEKTFLTSVNDGLNRIKDAIYGNTRADRMTSIDLRQSHQ
jgi:hypothetical protein